MHVHTYRYTVHTFLLTYNYAYAYVNILNIFNYALFFVLEISEALSAPSSIPVTTTTFPTSMHTSIIVSSTVNVTTSTIVNVTAGTTVNCYR